MDSKFWEFEPLEGDFQSQSALLLHLNVFTVLSPFRVRGARPDFRIPPNNSTTTVLRLQSQVKRSVLSAGGLF
jgi:hypothetical protein